MLNAAALSVSSISTGWLYAVAELGGEVADGLARLHVRGVEVGLVEEEDPELPVVRCCRRGGCAAAYAGVADDEAKTGATRRANERRSVRRRA